MTVLETEPIEALSDFEDETTENFLPTLYQQQIHQSKYARWNPEKGRRETWPETVDRYMEFVQEHLTTNYKPLSTDDYLELRTAILNTEILPSMRALMTAGRALERDNVAGYNCAFLFINRPHAFDEALYILCCGTGVGYSVERQEVKKLPTVPDKLYPTPSTIIVQDSKIGWATAYRELISMLYAGKLPQWDISNVRPAGAPLKTFGGRASGPGPLVDLFKYTVQVFKEAEGRKLNSEECHGLMCKVGDIVVVGGVRRSALICLSNLSDDRMRNAKSGQWYEQNPHYQLANISVAYTEKPEAERFIEEWSALIRSKSGERGIFNREAATKKVESIGRESTHEFGTNPCGEIILRDRQFCNLSEVVARESDSHDDLVRKVRLASILGTIQSTFTDFRYLSKEWKENCEEERLLGVSITGIQDNEILNASQGDSYTRNVLKAMRTKARGTNDEYALTWRINRSAAITCVKPSGNGSQLVNSASGIHDRYAEFYVRRNRGNKSDPVANVLHDSGIPVEDDIFNPATTWVFSYPQKAPEGAQLRTQRSALDQLEHWLIVSEEWCDHNPSITVNVKDHEWLEVGAFVYKHFDRMLGVTFLPESGHTYQQAPYEEITKDEYDKLVAEMPESINWELLQAYEQDDQTEGAKELACTAGGSCEIL